MHIIILADPIDTQKAGIHTYTKNLTKALLKDKTNTYTLIHKTQNKFFENTNHHITRNTPEAYRRFISIPKIIKKLQPDIVLEPAHIGPFRTPKQTKRVTLIHDLSPIILPKLHTHKNKLPHKLFLKTVLKNADLILTPSQNTKNDIIRIYNPTAPIEVVHAGIDHITNTENIPKNILPQNITLPYLLYIGTIEPRKNLEILIDAFIELKAENSIPHKLVLGGQTGWKSNPLLKKIRHHDHNTNNHYTHTHNPDIILTGYLTDPEKTALYKHADIFIYPSLYEGFGFPPLEAMSYGVPVISSTGGSLKEILQDNTLLFEPTDKEQLKKHILNLIHKPETASQLSKKGLAHSKTFTWEKTAKKTIQAFEKIMHQEDNQK